MGVVADPGVPTEVAHRIADGLPDEFFARVDRDLDWEVEVRSEALSLSEDGRIDIAEKAKEKKSSEGWDLVVCLTDLPRRDATRPVVADVDTEHGVGLASLPAIGWIRLRPYVRDIVVHIVGLLARETLKLTDSQPASGHHHARRWGWSGSQIRQVPSGNDHVDVTLVLPGVRGRLRLLFGMVRDNRPWRLVPELSGAIAAATATAAFGIFFPTIWSLADNLSAARLVLINLVAVFAMVAWITVHNGLWERPRDSEDRNKVMLYNAATLITLTIGVACMYALLFVITLFGSSAVISVDYLGRQLGHPATFIDYFSLSWLASSMGTVAGALGPAWKARRPFGGRPTAGENANGVPDAAGSRVSRASGRGSARALGAANVVWSHRVLDVLPTCSRGTPYGRARVVGEGYVPRARPVARVSGVREAPAATRWMGDPAWRGRRGQAEPAPGSEPVQLCQSCSESASARTEKVIATARVVLVVNANEMDQASRSEGCR